MRFVPRHAIGLALVLTVAATACAAGQSMTRSPSPKGTQLRAWSGSRSSVVEQAEIQSVAAGSTALQALRRLRPEFLRRHAPPMPADPEGGYAVVYLDGVRLGGIQMLESISASAVIEVRYLRAQSASEQLGRNHRGGVILVSTTR